MAEESSTNSNIPANSAQDLERFGDAAVAFDDMIVQVGRGIARAQEMMDLSQVEFQRKVVRAFQSGKLKRLDLNPSNAYTIPETRLDIKVGMSIRYPEGGGEPTLSAVPLNATSTNENDIDVETATENKLRFVSVPSSKEPPEASPSALTQEEAIAKALDVKLVKEIIGDTEKDYPLTDYSEEARLWRISWLKAREPELIIFIDDRKGKVVDVIYRIYPPTAEEVATIGEPLHKKVTPGAAKRGELLELTGDNFLTLSGQTVLTIDGRPVPLIRHTMQMISFKVPSWAIKGDVEVITPFGRTGDKGNGSFIPLPTFKSFEPLRGKYNDYLMKGTRLTLYGDNFRLGCKVRFATGAYGENIKILSQGVLETEVPKAAGTGPLALSFGDFTQVLTTPFIMLPTIEEFSPRQARIGEEVVIKGARLGSVEELAIGNSIIPPDAFIFQGVTEIRFLVPPDAYDGRIRLRERSNEQLIETESREIFHIVPRIVGFQNSIISRGEFLTIKGEGLDPTPKMMSIIFEGKRGISQANVLAVSADRQSLTVKVPDDCVSGFVRLIRKRIYSGLAFEDTSSLSKNKVTVLNHNGLPSDVIVEERFDGDLSLWQIEAGKWKIDRGALASEGTGRLVYTFIESRTELYLYTDVLNAGSFGFYFSPQGRVLPLQLWIKLSDLSSSISWSTLTNKGEQNVLSGKVIPQFAGKNYFIQVKIFNNKITLYINQEEIDSLDWTHAIKAVALLSNSNDQHWDNVLLLKREYLSLPDKDFYRFGKIPETPFVPGVTIDTFQPDRGNIGSEVTVIGTGFEDIKTFYFGDLEAGVKEITDKKATLIIPDGAISSPIEAIIRGDVRISSGKQHFLLPPYIANIVPNRVIVGEELHIIGINLPTENKDIRVKLLGLEANVLFTSPTLTKVRVPDVTGIGSVSVNCYGFTAQSPETLEIVHEKIVLNLVRQAEKASWSRVGGTIKIGINGEETEGIVEIRARDKMEDGSSYGPLLFMRPPAPTYRALRGEYPVMKMPEGRLELRLKFGMLLSAAPTPEDITEVDGVIFELTFKSANENENVLLPKSACMYDRTLENYVIDANNIAGKTGQVVVSVFPGRNGLRDDTAVVSALVVNIV